MKRVYSKIENYLPTCKHAFVRKEKSIAHNKVGVAEASKEEVMRALNNLVTFSKNIIGNLTIKDLYNLKLIGENSKNNRQKIVDYYKLGHCNGKTLLKRLNYLQITKTELENILND